MAGREVAAELVENLLGAAEHACLVDGAEMAKGATLAGLAAKENVLGSAQFGNEVELLMDDADAEREGFLGGGRDHLGAVEQDAATILRINAGEDLDEGGLARAVFAHKGEDFTCAELQADVAKSGDAVEGLGQSLH